MQQLMELTTIATTHPTLPKDLIPQDNYVELIEQMFQSYNEEIVLIEGEEGSGKTTLVKQFCDKFYNNAISVFIKPSSRFAYDPQVILSELYNQVYWLVFQQEYKELDDIAPGQFNILCLRFKKHIKNKNQSYYFVIDGLEDIPENENYLLEMILDFIPFGMNNGKVKFLISSNCQERIVNYLNRKIIKYKSFPIPGFSNDQVTKYFKDIEMSSNHIDEIGKICKGKPGELFTIKRNLQTGISVEDLLAEIHDKLPNLFEYEWFLIEKDDRTLNLLALLAHQRNTNKVKLLSQLLNITETEFCDLCNSINSLVLSDDKSEVFFYSESHRKFTAKKLKDKIEDVQNLMINYLSLESNVENLLALPTFLNEVGKQDELINVLSPDLFSKLLFNTQSLGALSRMAQLGLSASSQRKKDQEHFRFGMQSSLILENQSSKIWESEIKALISLNESDKAMALTQSNILIEDRLHMLAIIARHKKEQGLTPDTEITENISLLYNSIDINSLGEKALKIAEELIYTNPELAIELIEKSTGNNQSENTLDYALAKLSLAAMNGINGNLNALETFESLNTKINDPKMRKFFEEFSLFIKNDSAKELLAQVRKYESTSDQIYFLSNWCETTANREEIEEVIEYSLNLTVKTTEYAPNAGVYRKFSTPIPFLAPSEKVKQLVNLFESQIQNIEKIGPTEDYMLIQLNLAKAIWKYDKDSSSEKLVDLYLYIASLEDISAQTEGYANLLNTLIEIDVDKKLETDHGLHTILNQDLDTCTNELLLGTANQVEGFKGTIKALSKKEPYKTLELIEKLNTSFTRDVSYSEFINSYIDQELDSKGIELINEIIEKISDIDYFSQSVVIVIENLYSKKEEYDEPEYLKGIIGIFNKIRKISEPQFRCTSFCLAYLLLKDNDELKSFSASLLSELKVTWDSIDIEWRKVDIGFKIIDTLSSAGSIEYARDFLKEIEAFQDNLTFYDPNISWSFIHVIRLAIRAYSGLLSNEIDTEKDLEQISSLIHMIPSSGEQAILWSELSLRYFINKKNDKGKRLVLDKVKPCINKIPDSDLRYKIYVLMKVAPSLFTAHKSTCFELLENLPKNEKDIALYNISQFIFTKISPSDPFEDTPGKGFNINFEDVIDLCEIIEKIDLDNLIYSIITDISESVQQSKRFSIQQKLDIANRLEVIIERKLPNQQHIKHDGYKIVSLAEVLKIRQGKIQDWLDLINAARGIPNNSDKAYVLTLIACNFPRNKFDKIVEIIKEVDELVGTLPTISDKITKYEAMAKNLVMLDQVRSKGFIKKAMDLSLSKDDEGRVFPIQKRLIDFAHRIDPEFAQSLVSINDKDPARQKMRYELEEELQMLELKKKIINRSEKNEHELVNSVKVAWNLLGGLNSGRVGTFYVEEVRDYIDVCAKLPLGEAYPIYCWILENFNIRFKDDVSSASQYIRALFEIILVGAEFSIAMSGNNKIQINKVRNNLLSSTSTNTLIKAGEREKAIEYLKSWFVSNSKNYIKICDPYFGVDDLEILQMFGNLKPDIKYEILTSTKNQRQEGIQGNYEEVFTSHWKFNISDQDPPNADIVIVGKKSDGELPIHDRWIFTEGSGIRLGISYKSLGMKKDAEISVLDDTDKELLEEEVDKYLSCSLREYNGERLMYNIVPM